MKPDGTPIIEEILVQVDQLQEFEKHQLIRRIYSGGINTLRGRYNLINSDHYGKEEIEYCGECKNAESKVLCANSYGGVRYSA